MGGICYGNNAVSGNLIVANRANLLNGNLYPAGRIRCRQVFFC